MKRLLLLGCLLAAFACTKEPAEPSGDKPGAGARIVGVPASKYTLKGSLSLKLTPEMAQSVAAAQAQLPSPDTRSGVQTRSGVDPVDAILNEIGAEHFERIIDYNPEWEAIYDETGINRWYSVAFDDEADLAAIGSRFAALPGVAVVEYGINPKYIRPMSVGPVIPASGDNLPKMGETRAAVVMNDPMLPYQWNFDNPGPNRVFDQPKAGADIDLLDAWQLCTGSEEIVVAVIDQAVQTDHPDLKANIWSNPKNAQEHGYNFWDNSSTLDWKSATQDANGGWEYADHGTHVAGVIAAVTNNGRGVCGIAGGRNSRGGVKIMSCQIMGYSNGGKVGTPSVKALEYAWTNGAVIAQNSWGYVLEDETPQEFEKEWNQGYGVVKDAINTFIRGAAAKNPNSPLQGGLVIFAAGNDGDIYGDAAIYPAAYSPIIAVGAMDWAFRPAYYTDYGPWVDITAPGGDYYASETPSGYGMILSTILCDETMDFKDGRKDGAFGYGFLQGTSMACPHVTGVAALGLAYAAQNGKKYTPDQFKALLLSSVYGIDDYFTGSKDYYIGNTPMTIPDFSVYKNKMGGGCVDALKLLLAIKGTPAIYVKTGEPTTVDFARYFGGDKSVIVLKSAKYASYTNLGVSSSSAAFDGTKITFDCSKTGTSMLTISAAAGDTTIEREFAIVSRPNLAGNGGWL